MDGTKYGVKVIGNAKGFIAEFNFIFFISKASSMNSDCDYLTLGEQVGGTINVGKKSFSINSPLPPDTTSGNLAVWDFWVKVDNYAVSDSAIRLLAIYSQG
jgi:hypothetical protein